MKDRFKFWIAWVNYFANGLANMILKGIIIAIVLWLIWWSWNYEIAKYQFFMREKEKQHSAP